MVFLINKVSLWFLPGQGSANMASHTIPLPVLTMVYDV